MTTQPNQTELALQLSVLNFIRQKAREDVNTTEGLMVAEQCLEEAFSVEEEQKQFLNDAVPFTLLEVFQAGLESLGVGFDTNTNDKANDNATAAELAEKEVLAEYGGDLDKDKRFHEYLKKIRGANFFAGLEGGSIEYKQRFKRAVDKFISTCRPDLKQHNNNNNNTQSSSTTTTTTTTTPTTSTETATTTQHSTTRQAAPVQMPGAGAGAPPFDMGALSGMLNNPEIMGMAQQMMSNPAFMNMAEGFMQPQQQQQQQGTAASNTGEQAEVEVEEEQGDDDDDLLSGNDLPGNLPEMLNNPALMGMAEQMMNDPAFAGMLNAFGGAGAGAGGFGAAGGGFGGVPPQSGAGEYEDYDALD